MENSCLLWAQGLRSVPAGPRPGRKARGVSSEIRGRIERLPEPEAEAVWNHLETYSFKDWELWPGKGEFFEGQEPHGALLTNYLNEKALIGLQTKSGEMPPGAIIVKENYSPDKKLVATTVMYKAPGFDPEHNDWFWLKRAADGTVQASGKVAGCQGCHGQAADNDYVLTGSLK